MSKGVNIGTLL